MRCSTTFGAYEIDSAPGQPQIAHCHSLFVKADMRGQGNGHRLKLHQNEMLQLMGYDYATCTVAAANAAQIRVLETAGWTKLAEFKNTRNCETTELWGKHV